MLGQLGELRRERAPIDEQLGRLDDTTSAHDEAVKMRDRLLEHDAAVAEREQLTLTLSNLNRREAELRAQVSELGSRHKTGRIAR